MIGPFPVARLACKRRDDPARQRRRPGRRPPVGREVTHVLVLPTCGAHAGVWTLVARHRDRGAAPRERTHREPGDAREDHDRPGLRRRAGPERWQHPDGSGALRHPALGVRRRGRDVRPGPRDAHPHRDQPGLHRRPHPGGHPVRADHGPAGRGARHGGVPLAAQAGGALPQGRPGPGRRAARREDHEADPAPGRPARARDRARRLRHQDALGGAHRRRGRGRGRRRPAVRGGPADPGGRPGADHRARGRHPQPRQGRGRDAAAGRAARATSTVSPRVRT